MSKATACTLVKFLATKKQATVAELVQATGSEESNIRTWLYEMKAQGLVYIAGRRSREIKPGAPTRGIRMVLVYGWLL